MNWRQRQTDFGRAGAALTAQRATPVSSVADDWLPLAESDAGPGASRHARESFEAWAVGAQSGGRGGGRGGRKGTGAGGREPAGLLSETELGEMEATYAEGVTAAQVVEIFATRGIRFSEATFRKYVQQGLLPRSRRVGRKGKHRGSLGVYPAKTIRRINAIKQLMAENYTIEEIQQRFLRFTDVLETLEEGLTELFAQVEAQLEAAQHDRRQLRALKRDLSDARKSADELMRKLEGLTRRAGEPPGDRYHSAGAAGSAEDLL